MTEKDSETARLAVDIGGTFTDVVLEVRGRTYTAKVLTTSEAPEEGVLAGVDTVLGAAAFPPERVGIVIHGTTLATNAIIERKGAVTALIGTEGFRDVLEIGYEDRYDQYDVFVDKARPLVPRDLRFTVPERLDVEGSVRLALNEDAVRALVPALEQAEVTSVAVGFLHSYANPAHEERVRDLLLAALPELYISLSSEVSPEVREYERLTTTSANAYVRPLMARYLQRLQTALHERGFRCRLYLMTSGGGLTTLDTAVRFPIRLVESGPAGGAILASRVAAECGLEKVFSFDMGGTTAKICLIDQYRPQASRSFEVDRAARFLKGSGLPLRIPVIEMVEIGAGGGSIARIDAMGRVAVGPASAGSDPGPACYGRGGAAPTVTDADLLLGKIDPGRFAGGKMTLDADKAAAAIGATVGRGLTLSDPMAAFGITEMVDENMANAARVHGVERGKDIGDHAIIAFGGAAPLHAARIADKLGIGRIVVPTHAGVGSAVGFLRAPVAYEVARSRYMRLRDFDPSAANDILGAMSEEARAVVTAGAPGEALEEERQAYMRYVGQGHEIVVPLPARPLESGDSALLQETFDAEYTRLFARTIPDADIEILSWALAVSTAPAAVERVGDCAGGATAKSDGRRAMYEPASDSYVEVPVYPRPALAPGARLSGPALIVEDETTTVVGSDFDATIMANGYILLERRQAPHTSTEA